MSSIEPTPLIKRIVVQNCRTKQFLNGEEGWTGSFEEARAFPNSGQAAVHCLKLRVDGLAVLITFGPRKYDLVLPIQKRGATETLARPER